MTNFTGKTLLITGGTGSFGNTMLNKFLKTDIKEIRVFSRDEKKQDEMRLRLRSKKIRFIIGDVRSRDSVNDAMRGVDYVFHAAALKQVPSCEFYPIEAVKTNILGTENVLNAAISSSVQKVVVLSTDKAVYPINAMGISKAMMEKLMVAKSRVASGGDTIFCATRYGNVMASRGSVIPVFVEAAKNNLPITITDPCMTRFLMSLEDSVDLVLHAFNHANQGDIFVQKAPASTIGVLAEAIKDIFQSESTLTLIGTRHGEKLYECLLSREEMARAEDHDRFYRIPADLRSLNYPKEGAEFVDPITSCNDYNSHNTRRLLKPDVINTLLKLDYIKQQLGQ